MRPSGIVTLLTDFGLDDTYAGVLKGVIWEICPQARIADLTHQVSPQNILQGAYLLATACRYFPPGTVHLAVVDPGVGSGRAAIAAETPTALFVAPDNGLLSFVWEELSPQERAAARVVELREPRYWRPPVSDTFHGRDIFAPVAAHLAAGLPLESLGPLRETMHLLETAPQVGADGAVVGRILHVDHFGNCISNIRREQVSAVLQQGSFHCAIREHRFTALSRTYAEAPPGAPLTLIGSSGRLEIAVRNGSAAAQLGLAIGDPIRLWS